MSSKRNIIWRIVRGAAWDLGTTALAIWLVHLFVPTMRWSDMLLCIVAVQAAFLTSILNVMFDEARKVLDAVAARDHVTVHNNVKVIAPRNT